MLATDCTKTFIASKLISHASETHSSLTGSALTSDASWSCLLRSTLPSNRETHSSARRAAAPPPQPQSKFSNSTWLELTSPLNVVPHDCLLCVKPWRILKFHGSFDVVVIVQHICSVHSKRIMGNICLRFMNVSAVGQPSYVAIASYFEKHPNFIRLFTIVTARVGRLC